MEEQYGSHAIGVDARNGRALALGNINYAEEQGYVDPDQHNGSYKAPFLTHRRKDEVCTLVWYKVVFGLCALQVALAPKLARSYRNFGLVKLVSRTAVILYFTQNDVNAVALVG